MIIPSPVSRRKARIEIIPLIDIIFFLLATFVMLSLSMIKNQGIDVNLPIAHSGSPQDRSETVTITVSRVGEVYLNQKKTTLDLLPQRLEILKQEKPDATFFINGDGKAYFENAIKVLDDARMAGITKVSIQTQGADSTNQ